MNNPTIKVPIVLVDGDGIESISVSSVPLENILYWWKGLSGNAVIRLVTGEDLCCSHKFEVLDILLDTERNKQN